MSQSNDKYSQGLSSENMFYPNCLQKKRDFLLSDCGSQPPRWLPIFLDSLYSFPVLVSFHTETELVYVITKAVMTVRDFQG